MVFATSICTSEIFNFQQLIQCVQSCLDLIICISSCLSTILHVPCLWHNIWPSRSSHYSIKHKHRGKTCTKINNCLDHLSHVQSNKNEPSKVSKKRKKLKNIYWKTSQDTKEKLRNWKIEKNGRKWKFDFFIKKYHFSIIFFNRLSCIG